MYYLVNGCRFITEKKVKNMCSAKNLKNKF